MRNTQHSRWFFSFFLFSAIAATGLSACGTTQQQALVQKEIHALNNELRDMRRNMAAMETMVEDVQQQLVYAEEKLRSSERGAGARAQHRPTAPDRIRQNLEIVRLGPGGAETPLIPGDIPYSHYEDRAPFDPIVPSDPVVFQTLNADGQVVPVDMGWRNDSMRLGASGPKANPDLPLREKQNYGTAFAHFRAGRVQAAERGFKDFVASFPQSHLADNALYWWGECRYGRRDYVGALRLFQRILEEHPSGNKVPDGMVKMGLSLVNLGQRDEGLQILRQVSEIYPETPSAEVARRRHQKIAESHP